MPSQEVTSQEVTDKCSRKERLCCVGGNERPHVWDVVSEGQRNSNEAREKGMGLMVQGL